MVGLAIALAAGMMFGSLELISAPILFLSAALLLGGVFVLARRGVPAPLIFACVALVAACRFIVAAPDGGADSIDRMEFADRARVELIGHVATTPNLSRGRWTFELECEGLGADGEWKTTRGGLAIRARAKGVEGTIERGDQLALSGRIAPKLIPGLARYELEATSVRKLNTTARSPFAAWPDRLRRRAEERLEVETSERPTQLAIYKALVLGARREIPRDTMEVFRRTGSLHVFAISGLHVGIVGLLLAVFLKAIGVPRDRFWIPLLPLLTLFVVTTGMKSSATRALAMAVVFLLGPHFKRAPDVPSSIALAAVVLLWIKPLEILSAGFIFSFTVVACIVMVYSVAPKHWTQGGWWKTTCSSLLITSFAASLASFPLAALYFGTFSPISLIGNLIVVPLTFFIVLCGWLAILAPFASAVFNHAAMVFIEVMLASAKFLDAVPGSSWKAAPPSLWAIALWFGSLIYFFTHATLPRQRNIALFGGGAAALLALLG